IGKTTSWNAGFGGSFAGTAGASAGGAADGGGGGAAGTGRISPVGPLRTLRMFSPRTTSSSVTSVPLRSSRISRISFRFMSLPLRAFDVRPGPCVHLDPVSHVEEEGNLHHRPGRKLRRLGRPAHGIAP